MEFNNVFRRHLWGPCRRCKDEDVACSCILRVLTEFLRLPCGLSASAGNDKNIVEAIIVEGLSRERDSLLALVMGSGLSLEALHGPQG